MAKKSRDEEVEEVLDEDVDYAAKAAELQKNTQEIEATKAAKRLAREEKKFYKEIEKKNKERERWVAPLLLILTLLISYLIFFLHRPQ